MISRRSFFTGLAAALLAPKVVQRVIQRFNWHGIQFTRTSPTTWVAADAGITDLLKRRIADAQEQMAVNISHSLYGGDDGPARYLTLREILLERSERHFLRAQHWRIQGKPDYAMGSLMKAAVAEDRARSLPI